MTSDSPSLRGIDRKNHQASGAKQAFLRSFTGPVASGKMLLNTERGTLDTMANPLYTLYRYKRIRKATNRKSTERCRNTESRSRWEPVFTQFWNGPGS